MKKFIKKNFFRAQYKYAKSTTKWNWANQDRLMKNEKSLTQFQNGLMHIRRIRVKKGQRTNLSQTKEIQSKDIFQSKIKQIKKNTNLLQNILTQIKKRKR